MTQFIATIFGRLSGAGSSAFAALNAFLNPCPPPVNPFLEDGAHNRSFFHESLFLS